MKKISHWIILFLIFGGLLASCGSPDLSGEELEIYNSPKITVTSEGEDQKQSIPEAVSTELLWPEDLEYQGAFRLPDGSGISNWEYSGHGLTYYPEGDPEGDEDGFPGSLFGIGHDHQLAVSEISIPAPVISRDPAVLPTARTLQPFKDLSGGLFNPAEMSIPRSGIAYLPEPAPGIHFNFGQHIQDFEPSHGWRSLPLSSSSAAGPWVFGPYTNYITNDYLFDIPPEWARQLPGSPRLASGRAREGLWSGRGPALFAYQPQELSPGEVISDVVPLLLYGEQEPGMPDLASSPEQAVEDYHEADHWWGGAWLTAGDRAAVVFAGTKALGEEWYGFANGVVWEHDCAEQTPATCPDPPDWPYDNRGFWADDYQAQLIFYDPSDLVAVARGEIESWEPQPYAVLNLNPYLLDPQLRVEDYKRDYVGAAAFDRERGYLYIFERLADEYRSVVHVWRVASR